MDYMINGKVVETTEKNENSEARIKAYGDALKTGAAQVDFVIGNTVIETGTNNGSEEHLEAYEKAIKDKKD